jgi:phage terminase large subunit
MSERTVNFNRIFAEANESRARYRILMGGAGSGKSLNTAQDFILKLSDLRYYGANLLVIRKTESSCRHSVFEELCGAVRRIFGAEASRYWRIRQDPMELQSLVTGGRVVFRGMREDSQREKIKSVSFESGKLTWIWCEEATELEEADLEMLDDRLRGDLSSLNPQLYFQITLTFNPVSSMHWLKRRFWDVPASPEVFRHHSTYRDNAFIDGEYAARMERRRCADPAGYAVYAEGEWGTAGSDLILTHYRTEELDVSEKAYDACWMAQDFGYNHADCILLVGMRDGVLYVLRELYLYRMDTAEIIERAIRERFPHHLPMYCDSAEPDRIRMWQKAGFRALPVVKEAGSVAAQIDTLKQNGLVVDCRCENVLEELRSWRWMKNEQTGEILDEPIPLHDDAMAALRYATEPIRRGVKKRCSIAKSSLGLL